MEKRPAFPRDTRPNLATRVGYPLSATRRRGEGGKSRPYKLSEPERMLTACAPVLALLLARMACAFRGGGAGARSLHGKGCAPVGVTGNPATARPWPCHRTGFVPIGLAWPRRLITPRSTPGQAYPLNGRVCVRVCGVTLWWVGAGVLV